MGTKRGSASMRASHCRMRGYGCSDTPPSGAATGWLAGDRATLADVALYSYTVTAPEGGVSLQPYPRIRQWLARIEALPRFVPMPRTPIGLAA